MTSSRSLAVAGALVATLSVAGCSFSGSAQAPDGSASTTSPASRAPGRPAPSTPATTTPATTTPAPSAPGSPPPGQAPSSTSAPTGGQAPAGPPPGEPAGTAGSDDADPGRCATRDLAVSIGGGSGAAAGSIMTTVILENTGSAACTLQGFPGVSSVAGSDGHQVGAAARRDDGPTPAARVTLQPGGVAHAPLRVVQYQAYPAETCQPAPTDGYRVYPPGSKDAAFVRGAGTTCSAPAAGVLSVQPVEPGPPSPPPA